MSQSGSFLEDQELISQCLYFSMNISVFLSLLGQLLFSLPEFQLIVVWITNASSVLVLLPFLPSLLFALSLQFPKEN